MTEQECLERMVPPGRKRPRKWRGGVIQVWVTRACDLACFHCTQGSNLGGKPGFITPDQFEAALVSLRGYFGVVGVFGGNPALHPEFDVLCKIMREHVPLAQRGLWCNHPRGRGKVMRETFNPAVSNLNCHLSEEAFLEFKRDWPESMPFGLREDSRHSPVFAAMRDVLTKECGCQEMKRRNPTTFEGGCASCGGTGRVYDEARAWELISGCDINQHWSAMIGVFRGQLRAWFCEVAGAQAMLHQDEPGYPDTGLDPTDNYVRFVNSWEGIGHAVASTGIVRWWQLGMEMFGGQVRKHCHECGVPLRGWGELAQADLVTGPKESLCTCGADRTGPSAEAHAPDCPENHREQVSATHAAVAKPKRRGRRVEVVERLEQLGTGRLEKMTHYIQNAKLGG